MIRKKIADYSDANGSNYAGSSNEAILQTKMMFAEDLGVFAARCHSDDLLYKEHSLKGVLACANRRGNTLKTIKMAKKSVVIKNEQFLC